MKAHETHEKIEEAHHHRNKRVAILIAILAAFLAITEMGANNAQNIQVASNIEASNLWAFFQAKTIRMTAVRTAAESLEAAVLPDLPPDRAQPVANQIAAWRSIADRYDSEPSTNEGRRELMARAKTAEERRDHALAAYHNFEYGAAAFQLAIVLASASVITEVIWLALISLGLGIAGTVLSALGWVAPTLIHF